MDATALPLLYLCRRRAYLLHRALEALETPLPGENWACRAMKVVDLELDAIEQRLKAQKESEDGR